MGKLLETHYDWKCGTFKNYPDTQDKAMVFIKKLPDDLVVTLGYPSGGDGSLERNINVYVKELDITIRLGLVNETCRVHNYSDFNVITHNEAIEFIVNKNKQKKTEEFTQNSLKIKHKK